jgi:hypothetical protein
MLDYLLHRLLGIGEEGQVRVRFGAGVTGHSTYGITAACAAIGLVAWALREHPGYALGAMGIIAAVVLVFFVGNWVFADRHPDAAVMGGSDWRKFREAQLSSKNDPDILTLPAGPDPSRPLPPPTPHGSLVAPDEPDDA